MVKTTLPQTFLPWCYIHPQNHKSQRFRFLLWCHPRDDSLLLGTLTIIIWGDELTRHASWKLHAQKFLRHGERKDDVSSGWCSPKEPAQCGFCLWIWVLLWSWSLPTPPMCLSGSPPSFFWRHPQNQPITALRASLRHFTAPFLETRTNLNYSFTQKSARNAH